MEHRFFPTESVAGAVLGLRDGERVTVLETSDAGTPGYLVET